MDKLKQGWKRERFGNVARLCRETCKNPIADGIDRVIGLENLEPGSLRVRSWSTATDGTTFTQRVRPGQVLFGKRRAYQRKVAVADFDAICSGDIYVFESANPDNLLPGLLPFLCQTDGFFEHAVGTSAGSLSPRTNWSSLAEYEFELPPLNEQVKLLDALSSIRAVEENSLDAAIAAEAACVAGLLAILGVDLQGRNGRTLNASLHLAPGWQLCQVRDLQLRSEKPVQVGPFGGSLASRHFTNDGTAVLKVQNVGHYGYIDRSEFVYVSNSHADSLRQYKVQSDDIVIVAQGFTSGRVAMVSKEDAGALISQHLIRIRLDPDVISPKWMWAFLRSPLFHEQVAPIMMKTTRPGLNTEDILSLRLPLPPVSEQATLIDHIERLFEAPRRLRTRAADAHNLQGRFCRLHLTRAI